MMNVVLYFCEFWFEKQISHPKVFICILNLTDTPLNVNVTNDNFYSCNDLLQFKIFIRRIRQIYHLNNGLETYHLV